MYDTRFIDPTPMEITMNDCPCASGKPFDDCCGPVIAGERPAETAEALMRSRYSAFARGETDWLEESLHPDQRGEHDAEGARQWAQKSQWTGLRIVDTSGGGPEDREGTVEFVAAYRYKEQPQEHHEIGSFVREQGRWYYVDGKLVTPGTRRNEGPRIGRNDPCPCGSGRKYKKCCGA